MSAAGAALESDVQIEARDAKSNKTKTFNPGEGTSAKEAFVANFTPEQKAAIKEMIANASTPAEIERIEDCVKRGIFPGGEKLVVGNDKNNSNNDNNGIDNDNNKVEEDKDSSSNSLHDNGQRASKRLRASDSPSPPLE